MRRTQTKPAGNALLLAVAIMPLTLDCAALRLNGCRRIDSCGENGAYVCGGDVVCADRDGNTIRSQTTSGGAKGCRICGGE
jgi:hypothetical protein